MWRQHKLELFILVLVVALAGMVHGYNMFGFPYFENDEGTYMSQAWSLIKFGKLAPYTYWYDHAPAGWIVTAIWAFVSGGVFKFGFALNSGRVFMLLIHLLNTLLVLKIGKRLSGKYQAGVIASLIFSLSPLAVYFQRRLLLDNIMIFWVLAAFYCLIKQSKKLVDYFYSALFLGIGILTKENAIYFLPGFLYLIFFGSNNKQKSFSRWLWLAVLGFTVSIYVLYAVLKNEFFIPGTFLGGNTNHVSLVQTLIFQMTRTGGSFFNPAESLFWKLMVLWFKQDFWLMCLGITCQTAVMIMGILKKDKPIIGLGLVGLGFWYFLARGGIVIEFYILPLIPILSLFIGIFVSRIVGKFDKLYFLIYGAIFGWFLVFGQTSRAFPQTNGGFNIYKDKQTAGQVEAVDWIRNHIDTNAYIGIDQYSYVDLHDPENKSGKVFPNAIWYLKVDQDPEIQAKLATGSANLIDYVAKTPQMQVDVWGGASPTVSYVLNNSIYIKGFSIKGWGVEIWSNQNFDQIINNTWVSYKNNFLINGEKVIDPMKDNITTSEGQSYALLRSVWMNDKVTFDKVWNWTKINIQRADGTFSWKWGHDTILDQGSATDADTDIAMSLLFGYKKWGDQKYYDEALKVIVGIWNTEVRSFEGKSYITPGNWAKNKPEFVTNVSYYSPYAYRMFSVVDPGHDWLQVVDTSYSVLKGCTDNNFEKDLFGVGLPPNWCMVTTEGEYSSINEEGISSTDYSFDAVRTMWRIGLDYKWYSEKRAIDYLQRSGNFLANYWDAKGQIAIGYTHNGSPIGEYESVLAYSSALPIFTNTNVETARNIYQKKILPKFYTDKENSVSYWEDKDNYYLQNWSWFNIAYFANKLPNLWDK